MPISTLGSYLPTITQFSNHWTLVNVELGALAPLLLQGAYPLATFQVDRAALETAIIAVETADNVRTNAVTDKDLKKFAIRVRHEQFKAMVTGAMPGSIYVKSVPTIPNIKASEGNYLKPFDDIASLWVQINTAPPAGFTAPLLLPGGYTKALFDTELAALRAAFTAANIAIQNASIARDRRDILLAPIRQRLQQYRKIVPGRLPATSPLLQSIPRYSPLPGSTPDPVTLNGNWDAATSFGKFNITESTSKVFAKYQYRYTAGGSYVAGNSAILGDEIKINTLTFATKIGLSISGNKIAVKCFIITVDGNEAGSNTVVITRP